MRIRTAISYPKLSFFFGAALMCMALAGAADSQTPSGAVQRVQGEFPEHEGPYVMTVPSHWNGVLVLDLDYANPKYADSDLYKRLYELGYAGAGSTRGAEPAFGSAVDTPARVKRQLKVLDIFEQKFGKPKRVIAYGRSGAGGLAVAMVELAPERTA